MVCLVCRAGGEDYKGTRATAETRISVSVT